MEKEFVTIESHFGVAGNSIRANTRNRCSADLVGIIDEIAKILYSNDKVEIYSLSTEGKIYKDVVKIVSKDELNVAVIGAFAFVCLTHRSSQEACLWNEIGSEKDKDSKESSLQKQLMEMSKQYGTESIPKRKIAEICENRRIKELKNDRYRTLDSDDMIASDKTVLKYANSKSIVQKKTNKVEFDSFIEDLPQNEEYIENELEGSMELISLVIRQKREGKGITWRGAYYGKKIEKNGTNLLLNGEEINFYMQDGDFKKRIDTQKITFSKGDNIKVVFSLKGLLKNGIFKNRKIYITEVMKFNEEVIEHKLKFVREQKIKKEKKNKGQVTLFELGV